MRFTCLSRDAVGGPARWKGWIIVEKPDEHEQDWPLDEYLDYMVATGRMSPERRCTELAPAASPLYESWCSLCDLREWLELQAELLKSGHVIDGADLGDAHVQGASRQPKTFIDAAYEAAAIAERSGIDSIPIHRLLTSGPIDLPTLQAAQAFISRLAVLTDPLNNDGAAKPDASADAPEGKRLDGNKAWNPTKPTQKVIAVMNQGLSNEAIAERADVTVARSAANLRQIRSRAIAAKPPTGGGTRAT